MNRIEADETGKVMKWGEECSRPLLRYFGGKWRIAPWVISHFPKHHAYVEPFGGGGSVLLRKSRSYHEVYNDLDSDIVNVFRTVRDQPEELFRLLRNTPFAREEYDLSYIESEDPLERSRRTIVRSWMGFGNSAQRADGKTGFQAASEKTGSTKASQWSSYLDVLPAFRDRLFGVVIENRDAFEVIEQQDADGSLFFVDPPYVASSRLSGSYKYELSDDDHCRLIEALRRVRGMVILCGYENDLYKNLGWHSVSRETVAMSCEARTEVLWLNPACVKAQSQQSLF